MKDASEQNTNEQNIKERKQLTLSPEVVAQGQAMADEDLRSLSNFVEWLIDQEQRRRQEAA